MNVLLISETKLKAFTNLNANLDMEILIPSIFMSQELHLMPVIGNKGYKYYQTLVYNNKMSGATIADYDREMLEDFIAPILTWGAYYECLPEVWSRKMNKGVIVGDTVQGTAIDLKGLQWYRDNANQKLQFYIQRILDQIRAYPGNFPWFFSFTTTDLVPPSQPTYFAGVHFSQGNRYPRGKKPSGLGSNIPSYYGGLFRTDCCGPY